MAVIVGSTSCLFPHTVKIMNEKASAIVLANKILDRINGDPDDDLAMLARQLLRALERLGEYQPDVTGCSIGNDG